MSYDSYEYAQSLIQKYVDQKEEKLTDSTEKVEPVSQKKLVSQKDRRSAINKRRKERRPDFKPDLIDDNLVNKEVRDLKIENIINSEPYTGKEKNSEFKLSVKEFNESPYIVKRIDKITDYIHNNESLLGKLDLATVNTGGDTRPSEMLRDQTNRIATMLNHKSIFKDDTD